MTATPGLYRAVRHGLPGWRVCVRRDGVTLNRFFADFRTGDDPERSRAAAAAFLEAWKRRHAPASELPPRTAADVSAACLRFLRSRFPNRLTAEL